MTMLMTKTQERVCSGTGAFRNRRVQVPSHLEAARMEALSPPKQERATASGIVQFITPNTWSANVWRVKQRGLCISKPSSTNM